MTKAINRITQTDLDEFQERVAQPGYLVQPTNDLDNYQRIATKSAIYPGQGTPFGLMYAALGLAEAGEVQNKVKKAFRDDGVISFFTSSGDNEYGQAQHTPTYSTKPLPPERRAQIIKELGGALWYIAAMCNEINATLSEVALQNLEELCSRGERGTLRGDGDER